jgi:hypothetical protein
LPLHYDDSSAAAAAAAAAASAGGAGGGHGRASQSGHQFAPVVSATVPITVSPKSQHGIDEGVVVSMAQGPSYTAIAKFGEELAYVRASVQQQGIESLHRFREMHAAVEQLARRVQAGEAMIALTDELHRLKQADVQTVSSLDDARYQELLVRIQRSEERAITLAAAEAERRETADRLTARVATLEQALGQRAHDLEEELERMAQRQHDVESRLGMLDSSWQQRTDTMRRESEMKIATLDEARVSLQRQLEAAHGRAASAASAQVEQLVQAVQAVQARCEAICADVARDSEARVEQLRGDCRTTVDALSADIVVVKHSISGLTRLLNKTVSSMRHRSPSPGRGPAVAYAQDRETDSEYSELGSGGARPRGGASNDIAAFLSSLGAATR